MARGFALSALLAASMAASTSPIKYIIVVMMENRSFDHMLGHLGLTDSRVDGLQGNYSIPVNSTNPSSPLVSPSIFDAVDGGPVDPKHDFDSITWQVFGYPKPMNETAPVRMDGFATVATDGQFQFVMSAFNSSNLPVLSTLATEFAVFDHWHCSCPCPTNPNREFLMSGTSHGMTDNSFPDEGFPQQTHFAFLEQANIDWKIYYNDDPWMAPAFADLRTPARLQRVVEMPSFYSDIKEGTLPRYSLIQPRMASSSTGPSNWQHPDNSIEAGETFYSDIYEAVRNSPYWSETLIIITYDEHGGFYDHQATPTEGVPQPDNVTAANGFTFDRLGVRIPTVMISPWIAKGTVVNAPSPAQSPFPTSQWDATSIIATTNKIFGIGQNMTARDTWSARFDDIVSGATPMRTDCPTSLPKPAPLSQAALQAEMDMELNDHHLDSIHLLCTLTSQVGRGIHPVCKEYVDEAGRAEFLAELRAPKGAATATWALGGQYPRLHPGAAMAMRQQHFEAVSKSMWGAYKAAVIAQA